MQYDSPRPAIGPWVPAGLSLPRGLGAALGPSHAGPAATRLGWWSALLVLGVLAVNAAGVWEIAVTLRGLREHAERELRLATSARARSLESALSMATADLAFLGGSTSLAPRGKEGAAWRDEIGAVLLLFLRGHPAVKNLVVRAGDGQPVVEAGRPRGVPGYWVPGPGAPSLDVRAVVLRREFEVTAAPLRARGVRLDAVLDPAALLDPEGGAVDGTAALECALTDAAGLALAGTNRNGSASAPVAAADVAARGWGAPAPWRLECRPAAQPVAAELEPLVARHRSTIVINLVVMGLAGALGLFAYQQARHRQQLEQRAREEARVRELERQLFHAERLGTAGRLAAGMAHEINNPLEGLANYQRLAADALARDDAPAVQRHLEGVRQGIERAAAIVRRVLDHADPAASLHEVVDLNEVVVRSVDFVRSRSEFAAIDFVSELAPGPLRARGSSVMLGQVFLNLVLNACEAQPGGGEVRVTTRRTGDAVEVEVADRGPGVPEARRSRIFEPFETTKRSAGLGLSICHSIVEQHEGELSVHDRPGGGAVFRVRLGAERERAGGTS